MIFKEVKISELVDFVKSNEFSSLQTLPVSSLRAISQANNPKAFDDDTALLMALNNKNEVIGYIGLLPDKLNNLKVYWNTCWWIDPIKGKKISMILFYKALKLCEEKMLLTDMTKHTKKIIFSSGRFHFFAPDIGYKGYLKFRLRQIILYHKPRLSFLKYFFNLIDTFLNIYSIFLRFIYKIKLKKTEFQLCFIERIDNESILFIENHNKNELLKRDGNDLNWILNYPWINPLSKDIKNEKARYYFSSFEDGFEYKMAKIYNLEKKLIAFLFLRFRQNHVLLPYAYFSEIHKTMVNNAIIKILLDHNALSFQTFHPMVVPIFFKIPSLFVLKKKIERNFAVSNKIKNSIPENYFLQDGDGDVVFT